MLLEVVKERIKNLYNGEIECIQNNLKDVNLRKDSILCKCNRDKNHGVFTVRADYILKGQTKGCPYCCGTLLNKNIIDERLNTNFNGNIILLDDYVPYKNNTFEKFHFKCLKHNYTYITNLNNTLNSSKISCPKCKSEYFSEIEKSDYELTNEKVKKISFNNLSIDKESYKGVTKKCKIFCKKHNHYFERQPSRIIYSNRIKCNLETMSMGELIINNYLEKLKINFKYNYNLRNLGCERNIKLDFYLPDLNKAIEFDGKQHTYKGNRSSRYESYEVVKERDDYKDNFCINNNIELLRIEDDSKGFTKDKIKTIKKYIKDFINNKE